MLTVTIEISTRAASDDEYSNGTRDDDDDAKTIVASDDEYSNSTRDDDDDARTIVDVSSNERDDSVNDRMMRQKNLLIKNKSGKNYKKKSMRFFVVHGGIT